jgi:hypothetical protein
MTRIAFLVALALAATLPTTWAQAQNIRSFVSAASGSDSNPCNRTAPCRTFQHAHDVTNGGGEINTLDPGGYGTVTITKAISIISGTGGASILVPSSGSGITINAGATDGVIIRGLIIESNGASATFAITFNSGGSLVVDDCLIHGLSFGGIYFVPNASSSLSVSHTVVANIPSNNGIFVSGTTANANVNAALSHVEMHNLSGGVTADGRGSPGGSITVSVADSTMNNTSSAVNAIWDTGAAPVVVTLTRSVIANNGTGLNAFGANATIRLAASTVSGNSDGWTTFASGSVLSAGDNTIEGNASFQSAPPTYSKK